MIKIKITLKQTIILIINIVVTVVMDLIIKRQAEPTGIRCVPCKSSLEDRLAVSITDVMI